MKARWFLVVFALIMLGNIYAAEQSEFGIKFNGFVKTDLMYDSRQTVAAREGHFLLSQGSDNRTRGFWRQNIGLDRSRFLWPLEQ